ncbi:MAG: type II toxin-antitoxin system VapC family toxin [Akkermansiaceae bacterium]|nr:type II toxin-antitoxin system VapC family toxin [Armatimonadota bacterium]
MRILDTDHMSFLQYDGDEAKAILLRLRSVPKDDIATTVATYEEQMRGRMARLASTNKPQEQIVMYREMKQSLQQYCFISVLDFDTTASAEFAQLRKTYPRLGTMDLKIAAIALANNATLLTRNSRDFDKIPGLLIEDWTV